MWSSNQILHPIDDTLQQGLSSMEVQQVVLNNIDRVAGNRNIEPIIDHQLVLAQTNRQNPGVEDLIDYYIKELQPSDLDDIEIDASLSGDLDDIEMLDLDGCLGQGNRKKRSTKGSCTDSRSDEMIMKIKLKGLESKINDEVPSRHEEIENVAAYNVNKSDMLSNASQSLKLSKMLLLMSQKNEVSTELQEKAYYNALIDIGALIHDHKDHVHGDHLSALESRVQGNQLFSVAYDLYYLSKSGGNVDQDKLYSDQVKSKISSYMEGENRLDDIYSEFNIIDIKGYFSDSDVKDFYTEAEAYDKEVITIHSTQVFADGVEIYVEVKDNNGNHQKLVIGDIASIQNIENYVLDREISEIKLRIDDDKEYTTTQELEEGHVKHYLNIPGGYKVKVGNIISSFAENIKKAIHSKLHSLELSASKKDVEEISNAEITDQDYNNVVDEVKQSLLQKGVREDTFNQLKNHLDSLGKKVFVEYISDVEKKLEGHGIEFDRNKFDSAKVKGAKSGKFFSFMAIYDLFDSISDVPTLGRHDNDALKKIFGINSILDAINDIRESLSASYIRSDGKVITKISRDSTMGKVIGKVPDHIRKTFVKIINNPVVQGITFATIAYQFGYSINEIAKGNHHPLNYYWTASSGIKLASMSIKPISIGVSSAMKGISATTKVLRGLSAASKVLGKISSVTMVADVLMTIGVEIHERMEYTKAITEQVPLLPGDEQAAVFFAKVIKDFTGRNIEKEYEDSIILKEQLLSIKIIANDLLSKNQDIGAVVLHVNKIEMEYDEIIKFTGNKNEVKELAIVEQVCAFEKVYSPDFKFDYGLELNSSTLNVSQILPLTSHTLVLNRDLAQFGCDFIRIFSIDQGRSCEASLNDKRAYFIDLSKKHLPHLSWYEYENDGLRVVSIPQDYKEKTTCSDIVNDKYYKTRYGLLGTEYKCNVDKVYRKCTKVFTLPDQPFIFTNIKRGSLSLILYLSGPNQLTAAENYPAVMHVPKGRVDDKGSKNHETIFVINHSTFGNFTGGIEKKNTIIINAKHGRILANLHTGMISRKTSDSGDLDIVLHLANVYNYISNSHNSQEVHTDCGTRLINVNSTKGNSVVQGGLHCKDQDYEIRVVNQKDIHYRGLKQTIFVVSKDSNDTKIVNNIYFGTKKNLDIIFLKDADIAQLKINEHQADYSLELLTDDKRSTVTSTKIDSFENLVIQVEHYGITKTIIVQDESLPDIIGDMAYQMKLNHSGTDIDRKILENSKKRSKAVITADITGSGNTTVYVFAKKIAESSGNLGIIVSQIELIKGDITLHYAVNNINQIKLILNNSTGISAGERENYNSLLFEAIKNGNLNDVKDLLDKGAEIEAEKSGFTALTYSLYCEKDYIVYFLLEMGADVNNRGKNNMWPLELAIYIGYLNLVKELVSKGVNICPENYRCEKLPEIANKAGNPEIADFLREKQNKRPVQRKRRHHHGDHPHHHSLRKLLATDLSNQPEIAANSANQKSSWINVFANTIVDAVKGVSKFIFSPFKPAIDMKHSQPSKAITAQGIDTNGTLLLLDVFIRKVTGQKYISNDIRSISEQEAQIYALPIAKEFEQALESAAIESGIPVTNLKFNPVEVFLKVAGQIRSGKFSEISKTLYSSAKEACPEFEQTGEFLVHVKSHLEEFLAKKETVFLQQKQTADQPTSSVSRKVVAMEPSKKPDINYVFLKIFYL
ncbi:MAG: ankyrin repeat domain-containing protein [Wolbachia endosymbiont of Andrena nigroaenea]|nr:ankyrin repeat domain-containing protein [Wolbachia endosymbiont of Andrena nigroaenea]